MEILNFEFSFCERKNLAKGTIQKQFKSNFVYVLKFSLQKMLEGTIYKFLETQLHVFSWKIYLFFVNGW